MIGAQQMSLEQHVELGIDIAWFTADVDDALRVASWELCQAFKKNGVAGITRFEQEHAESLKELRRLDPLSPKHEADLERLYWS